ncbi:G-box-binding factor 1-like isoform X5 [Papaver somniferum]|uniref:G-box-binding factor 1-like isoform X5 n=1 Tax=Papaver somniferum TaxID=3469 RepID=UPI000E6F7EEA|nr:G-box-binding factor 1-like isoform X5 [Papaver somniferum]
MGTGEESTAAKPAAPTASTQETPPTATYPDWTTQMQHLMPPYGTPIPYPGLYPHGGLYPHPGVPPPAPDAVKEIEGKGPDRKERGSTKKSKGNSGNAGLVVGKSGESAKLTSGSGNDGASQSADSGSEGVSQSSDENTNQREVGTKKKGFNQMLAEGANAQNNDTVGYSGAVVPATVPGNPVGTIPGTNLNMGMDLWNTSPVGTIPLRAATVPPKMVGREGVPADHVWVQQDERELKRQKRKQSNRESARRSRLRKQAECEDLQSKVEILNNENHSLSDELQRLSEQCEKLSTENKTLMEELNQLYGPDAVAALQGVSTNMLAQSVHGDGKGQDASIQSNNLVSGHPNGSLYNSNSTQLGSN